MKPKKGRHDMNDENVNHPAHYGGDTVYEAIKVIEAWGLGFSLGNAVKYIARAGKKSPSLLEDLRKAQWYINRAITMEETAAKEVKGDGSKTILAAIKPLDTNWRMATEAEIEAKIKAPTGQYCHYCLEPTNQKDPKSVPRHGYIFCSYKCAIAWAERGCPIHTGLGYKIYIPVSLTSGEPPAEYDNLPQALGDPVPPEPQSLDSSSRATAAATSSPSTPSSSTAGSSSADGAGVREVCFNCGKSVPGQMNLCGGKPICPSCAVLMTPWQPDGFICHDCGKVISGQVCGTGKNRYCSACYSSF